MARRSLTIRDLSLTPEVPARTLGFMFETTHLTRRLAVDNCRTRSALCRMR